MEDFQGIKSLAINCNYKFFLYGMSSNSHATNRNTHHRWRYQVKSGTWHYFVPLRYT